MIPGHRVLALLMAIALPALLSNEARADRRAERLGVLKEAVELRRSAQYDAAAALLEGWMGDDRTDDPVVFMLAEVYVALGRPDAAVKVWFELLEQRPPQEHRYRQVAQRARQIRREETAIQILLDGRLRLGRSDLFALELAELYLPRGEFDEAIGHFIDCLSLGDCQYDEVERLLLPHASAHLQPVATTEGESTAWSSSSNAEELMKALDAAAAQPAWHERPDIRIGLAKLSAAIALEMGTPEKGVEALRGIASMNSVAATDFFQYAIRCDAMGQHGAAAAAYELFLQHGSDPSFRYQAMLRLSKNLVALGQVLRAASTLGELIETAPPTQSEGWEARVHLAHLQLNSLGDRAAAARTLGPTRELATTIPGGRRQWIIASRWLLAQVALLEDDLETAVEVLTELTDQAEGGFRLAELLYYRGDFERATALLDSFVTVSPAAEVTNDGLELLLRIEAHENDPLLTTFARAQLLDRQGRTEEAMHHWQSVWLEGTPDLRELSLLTRARFLEETDASNRSLDLYDLLLKEFPEGSRRLVARLGRARILEQIGRSAEALREYESSLLLHPDDPLTPQVRLDVQRLRLLHKEVAPG